jgi:putative tryptophan/tyrosine transport system substrate-binding protein
VALSPDVILSTPPALRPLLEVTRIIPIVFVLAIDPVGDGSVASLARPGGSVTGFASAEPANATKYVEVLKEIAPHTTRMTYIHNPLVPGINKMVDEFVAAARSFGVEAKGVAVRDGADIERSIEALAQEPNGALMVPSSPGITEHLDLIVALASRHRLPTIGSFRFFPARGGLMSWGTDDLDQFRSAASYVDRILKGAKPADLPVQYPTKYAMVINLKAAKAIGLTIPESFLLRADEVIE